jgi:PhnB protein
MSARPPEEFSTVVTATLSVRDWGAAMEFSKRAFGAVETYSVPGGGVGRLSVEGAEFWVAQESPEHQNFSPQSLGGCSVRMLLIAQDPQTLCRQAVAAGATPLGDCAAVAVSAPAVALQPQEDPKNDDGDRHHDADDEPVRFARRRRILV